MSLCKVALGGAPIGGIHINRRTIYIAVFLIVSGALLFFSRDPESHPVAIRYDAIGDSITFGDELSFDVDQSGYARRTSTTFQGWPELLGHMLTERTGTRTEVLNKGHQGDRAVKSRVERLPEMLNSGNRANHALLLIGTNDSNDFHPTPSGHGCTASACDNTYKGHMQYVIQSLQRAGRDKIYIGILAPVWGPNLNVPYPDPLDFSSASRNERIVQYNQVIIDELLTMTGVESGPDLFTCFLTPTVNRFSLFKDTLHPNALGYTFMAALWRDAITGAKVVPLVESCPSPIYILESLDPYTHGHKQDLLDVGDEYYTDATFELLEIPSELTNGIWVLQANADKANTNTGFLKFDAGAFPVSIYIAYDPAGSPPTSKTHQFRPTTLSSELIVSDPLVGTFSVVKATGVTGRVVIGGNRTNPAAAPQQGYVVIVVP